MQPENRAKRSTYSPRTPRYPRIFHVIAGLLRDIFMEIFPLSNRLHRRLSQSTSHEIRERRSRGDRESRTKWCTHCLYVHSFVCCYLRQILTQFILVQFIGVSIRMITSPYLHLTQPCRHSARQRMTS